MTISNDMYLLMSEEILGDKHRDLRELRVLSHEELLNIRRAITDVITFSNNYGLYEICRGNYNDLIQCYDSLRDEFLKTLHFNDDIAFRSVNEINRRLINYLSSFKTFLDHYRTRYYRLDRSKENEFKAYEEATSFCFDNSFPYRFFSKLRNYAQHCGLPIGVINANASLQADGTRLGEYRISFDRDELLQNNREWGSVKKDLANQPRFMEMLPLISELQRKIDWLNILFTNIELQNATDSWKILIGLFIEVQSKYPNAIPRIVHQVRRDNTEADWIIQNIPIRAVRRMQELSQSQHTRQQKWEAEFRRVGQIDTAVR